MFTASNLAFLIIGIYIGWFTKVPHLRKEYREAIMAKKRSTSRYNKIIHHINAIEGLSEKERFSLLLKSNFLREENL